MYKIEIFSEKMQYLSSAFLPDGTNIEFDYLTLDSITVTVTDIKAYCGCFTHITDSSIAFDGIVSDVQPGKHTVNLTIKPLLALFDFSVFCTGISDAADFIESAITAQMVSNGDVLQNRPVVVTNSVSAASRPISVSDSTVNLDDVIISAIKSYGIVVDASLDMKNLKINADIREAKDTITIEADLENVVEKEVTLGNSYGGTNKITIRNTTTSAQATYYLHTDGTITEVDTDRVTPVFFKYMDLEDSETWDALAKAQAVQAMTPSMSDNEIKLSYIFDDKIARPFEKKIGTLATIYTGRTAYRSILTGWSIESNLITLVFGSIRVDLTKKLILERRK